MRPVTVFVLLAMLCFSNPPVFAQSSKPLFDGKSLEDWEGDTKKTWRVQDGAIVGGSLEDVVSQTEFLCTKKSYSNFELKITFKLLGDKEKANAGIQFRSKRIPNHYEVIGYQADCGEDNYWGGLFDENRRVKFLAGPPTKDVLAKIVKHEDWNQYRIRCEGPRIRLWLNHVLTADYTESDEKIERNGIIGLQIHGGAKAKVFYKDITLEELESDDSQKESAKPPFDRLTKELDKIAKGEPFKDGKFELKSTDVVVFTGSENMVVEQQSGWIEGKLTKAFVEQKPRFRHMGFEGDTVYRQNRMMNWGTWKENFDAVEASVVFAWFGQVEAFDITRTPEDFAKAYEQLLDQFSARTKRVVILAPPPFEKPSSPYVPDNRSRNERIKRHSEIARKLARSRGFLYVDLFTPLANRPSDAPLLTRDGMHFTSDGMREVADLIAQSLGVKGQKDSEILRNAILEKNRLWFDAWRCMNWAFAYGDRTSTAFATSSANAPPLSQELKQFRPLVAYADATILAIAGNSPMPAALPPVAPRNDPSAISVEEQIKKFVVRDGFSVNLFADEKLKVARPIQIRWDERGRLFVLCTPSYPQLTPGQKANDFIVRLDDTDGDGVADNVVVVAENLTMPMGFEFGDGGIYVCESTQLVHLKDTHGSGRMDSRRVVLSGFGTGDSHQNINSIRWGADGCLWFTQGYHIWSYVETPHGLSELNRSGIWRFNPRTLRLDSYLNESTAGLNCWGTSFDDYGQLFHASGADVAVWHTTPATIPTLHPLSLGTGFAISRGKSMEPEFLGSSHLPPNLRGVLLKSTYFTSQVQLYRLEENGAGFRSTDLGDLISSRGNEFRPLETRVGPDGAIYICDWLNPIIGHYQASYRDPRRDQSHGRIWRVTAKNRPLISRPKLETMSATELIAQLSSPERWVRDQAKYTLYRLPKADVVSAAEIALRKEEGKTEASCRVLYELSGVFAAHEEARPQIIDRLLASEDFHWRAWGAHLIGIWAEKLPDPLVLVAKAAGDTHPRVRMEAVVSASYVAKPEAMVVATLVLEKPLDPSISYSLAQTVHSLAPLWKPALAEGNLYFGTRYHALAYVLATAGDPKIVSQMRRLLESAKVSGVAREQLLATLISQGGPNDVAFVLRSAPVSPVILDALNAKAKNRVEGDYGNVIQSLLVRPDAESRIVGCRLASAVTQNARVQLERITGIANDEKSTVGERAAAIVAIGKIRGKESVRDLTPFLESEVPEINLAAIQALSPYEMATVARRVSSLLKKVKISDQVGPLFLPLLNRKQGPALLGEALLAAKPDATQSRLALQWMGESGYDDVQVVEALKKAADITAIRLDFSEKLVSRLVADAKAKGDATRGANVFRTATATCLKCHKVGDEGGKAGPDLTAIARAQSPESIVESVYWPKRQVKEGYLLMRVIMLDGKVINGYKERETKTEIVLRNPENGQSQVLRKVEIEDRRDSGTIMPDGLLDPLTERDRNDLLRYLFSLGR